MLYTQVVHDQVGLCKMISFHFITFLAKEVMFSVASVCVICYKQRYSKSYEWIAMKFYEGVQGSTRKN